MPADKLDYFRLYEAGTFNKSLQGTESTELSTNFRNEFHQLRPFTKFTCEALNQLHAGPVRNKPGPGFLRASPPLVLCYFDLPFGMCTEGVILGFGL